MSAQRVQGVLLLAMALASCAVHCWQFGPGREVPPRCRQMSVTAVSCAGTHFADNLLPHPDDCRLFYYCVSPAARPICRQCPARLHFNPRLRVCDHPAFAGCSAPSSTAAPTQDTTAADVATTGSTDTTATTGATTPVETTTDAPTTEAPTWGTTTWETTGTAANP